MVRGLCMGHSPPGSPLSFSSLWEAISTGLLRSGSPFVFAHSHSCLMAGHHMPLLKLILLTGIVSSTYQPFTSYPPQVQTDTPLGLPIPHPTLDITRKIYSKAISKSYCWKYRIALDWTLDHHWEDFPRKLPDFDTELNVLCILIGCGSSARLGECLLGQCQKPLQSQDISHLVLFPPSHEASYPVKEWNQISLKRFVLSETSTNPFLPFIYKLIHPYRIRE